MTHTPGPWRIDNLESYDAYPGAPFRNVWAGDPAKCIARAIDHGDVDANAALIAAAPDLLNLVKGLLELWPMSGYELDAYIGSTFISEAEAILARVKGKPK